MTQHATEPHTHESLSAWLSQQIALYVKRPATEISATVPLVEYGLDSVSALSVAAELEDYLGIAVDGTVMWDNPTIDALSAALIDELAKPSAAADH
ncbi:acyl carrier protein [Streptomyces sp. NPDC007100]|uniref:acyl carrier protein n=1 Tax=unclassified Streptomyces TaxID=2593676 RepID=UPI0033DD4DA5